MQLVVDEVITEALEADNVTLQNLNASKHVQVGLCYFGKQMRHPPDPNIKAARAYIEASKSCC